MRRLLLLTFLSTPILAQFAAPYAPKIPSLYRRPNMPAVQGSRDVAINAVPCDPVNANGACSGMLAVFRVEVDLPAGVVQALGDKGREFRIAIESEVVPGVDAPQTPPEYPPAHLRRFNRNGSPDARAVSIVLKPDLPPGVDAALQRQSAANRFFSPWIVAIADPRASIHYQWPEGAAKAAAGCYGCERPDFVKGKTEADGVYEIYTAGRSLSIHADLEGGQSIFAGTAYAYLAEKGRFEARVSTVMADTVRPLQTLVAAQDPPIAAGLLQETAYVHSGEIETSAIDLDAGGRAGWNVAIDRTYRSRTIGTTPFGSGWTSSIFRRLRELPNGDVEYRDGAGEVWRFVYNSALGYTSPRGLYLRLNRTEGWTLLDQKRRITQFDAYGRLVLEADEFYTLQGGGNATRYLYDAKGRLATIVDAVGRRTDLTYNDATGLVAEISDWRGRKVTYTYDGALLKKVELPQVQTTNFGFARPAIQYRYFDDIYPAPAISGVLTNDRLELATNLKAIIDPNESTSGTARVSFAYGNSVPRDQVASQTWATNEVATFAYAPGGATTTDVLGEQRTYTLTANPTDYNADRVHVQTLAESNIPTVDLPFGELPQQLSPTSPQIVPKTRSWTFGHGSEGEVKTATLSGVRTVASEYTPLASGLAGLTLHCQTTLDPGATAPACGGPVPAGAVQLAFDYQPATAFLQSAAANGLVVQKPEAHRNNRNVSALNNSVTTNTTFDEQGRVTEITGSGGTDPSGVGSSATITYQPDAAPKWALGRPKTIDRSGLVTRFEFPLADQTIETDARGVITTTDFDSWRLPTHVFVSGPGKTLDEHFAYDANGRLRLHSRKQSDQTITTRYDFDLVGRLTTTTTDNVASPSGSRTTSTTYDLANHKIVTTAPGGAVTTTELDALGRASHVVTTTATAPGTTTPIETRYGYDLADDLVYATDLLTAQATAFDAQGRPTRTLHSDGTQTRFEYDAWSHPTKTQQVSVDGETVFGERRFSYTDAGRLQQTTTAVDATRSRQTNMVWDGGGRSTGVATGNRSAHKTFDLAGRIKLLDIGEGSAGAVTSPSVSEVFDAHTGELPQRVTTTEKGGDSYTAALAYDTTGDVIRQSLANLTWARSIDEGGNVTSAAGPARAPTTWKYDARGAVTRQQLPNAPATQFDWQDNGSLLHFTDPTTQTTSVDSDLLGRPLKRTYPDSTIEQFTYEGSRLKTFTDREGRTQVFTYNAKGQLTRIDRQAGEQLDQIDYDDATGRLIRWTNKDTSIFFTDFDLEGHPQKTVHTRFKNSSALLPTKETLDEYVILHRWNEQGERSYVAMPSYPAMPPVAGWTTWLHASYDALGNLSRIERVGSDTSTSGELVLDATFRNARRPATRTVSARTPTAGGTATPIVRTYGYESETGRLNKLSVSVGTLEVAGSQINAFDGIQVQNAQLLGVSGGARTSEWSYDKRSRLASATVGRTTIPTFNDSDFLGASSRTPRLDPTTRAKLSSKGVDPNTIDPPSATMAESPAAHKVTSVTQDTATRTFTYANNAAERTSDGKFDYEFDEKGRLVRATQKLGNPAPAVLLRVTYAWDGNNRMVGRRVEAAAPTTPDNWQLATPNLLTDGLPADATFLWDVVTDHIAAIFKAGASQDATIDSNGGLVRQFIYGDLTYDDPIEVTLVDPASANITRLYPIYDEAVTGSLQAVLNSSGEVVSRSLMGDAYGDDRSFVTGAAVDHVSVTATKNPDGTLDHVDVELRATEELRADTIATGTRLAVVDAEGVVLRASPVVAAATTPFAVRFTLSASQWQALVDSAPVTVSGVARTPASLSIAVTSTLRASAWSTDLPVLPAPTWVTLTKPVFSSSTLPLEVRESVSSLAQWIGAVSGTGTEVLYDIPDLRLVGGDTPYDDPARLLVFSQFQALPFFDSVTQLSYARQRWLDHTTGSFLTPDPLGYTYSPNLYAFAGGDPVNGRDPSGMGDETPKVRVSEAIACTAAGPCKSLGFTSRAEYFDYLLQNKADPDLAMQLVADSGLPDTELTPEATKTLTSAANQAAPLVNRMTGALGVIGSVAQGVAGVESFNPTMVTLAANNGWSSLKLAATGESEPTMLGKALASAFTHGGLERKEANNRAAVAELSINLLTAWTIDAPQPSGRTVASAAEKPAPIGPVSRVIHYSEVGQLGPATGRRIILSPYSFEDGAINVHDLVEREAALLGGQTLAHLPGDMAHMAPEINTADQIIFYTAPGLVPRGGLTMDEMIYIQTNEALRGKTTFVYGLYNDIPGVK